MMILLDIFLTFYQGSLIVYTLKKQFHQRPHSLWYEAVCIFLFVLYIALIQYLPLSLPDLLCFIFPFIYIRLTTGERFSVCALWCILDAFLFASTLTLLSGLFDIQVGLNGSVVSGSQEAVMIFCFAGNAAVTLVLNIAARLKKAKNTIMKKELLIFFLMLALYLGIDECFLLSRISNQNAKAALIGSFCSFAGMILTMVLYEKMAETMKKKQQAELENQSMELINKSQQELKSIYTNILSEQHDLRHRIAAAEEIMASSDIGEEQRNHVLSLLQTEKQPFCFSTGIMAADAVLKAKSTLMENAGIDFEFCEYPLSPLPVSEQNFCMLLGNLLDNAIEGVMRLPKSAPSRRICLSFSKVWDMLFITCSNDADTDKIIRRKDTFVSSKEHPELHGFGTKNMKRIVNEAGGTIDFEIEKGKFTVQIMIGKSPSC